MSKCRSSVALALGVIAGLVGAAPAMAEEPKEPTASSMVYETAAVIDADVSVVWNLLVDLDGYADWNPWVVWAEGDVVPGGWAQVDVVMAHSFTMRAEHVVLAVDPESRFCWRDAGWNAWFVYGQRCRWLTPQPDGSVLLEQQVLLDGPLAGISSLFLGAMLEHGIIDETAALKARAESP